MKLRSLLFGSAILAALASVRPAMPEADGPAATKTWAERLGWPAGRRVVIFHADDIGMCYEANQAAQRALPNGEYRSASAMVPCPWFSEMAAWCVAQPGVRRGPASHADQRMEILSLGPGCAARQGQGIARSYGMFFSRCI